MVYADNFSLIGNYIRTTERIADVVLNPCKDFSLIET
jgi:hypothetical protein